jgi:hypothetical protein
LEKQQHHLKFTGKRLLINIIGEEIKKRQAYKPGSVFQTPWGV